LLYYITSVYFVNSMHEMPFKETVFLKTNQPTHKERTVFSEHQALEGVYLQQTIVSIVKN